MDARQRAVPAPQIKVVIHRALRRQVLGHRRPLAARRQHVEKPVQNLTDINPAPPPAALGRRDQRLHKRELLILQIARIAHCPALVTLPVLTRPHGGSLLAKPRRPLKVITDSCDSKTSRMDTKCSEYFVWFSDWQVAPATQVLLVNQLRTPCEGNHSLIERPGVLLDGASLHDMTSASAMIFLLMAFKWNGYLLSKCAKQSLYFFEGLIKASCDDDGPKQQFLKISQRFGLQVIGTSEPADLA